VRISYGAPFAVLVLCWGSAVEASPANYCAENPGGDSFLAAYSAENTACETVCGQSTPCDQQCNSGGFYGTCGEWGSCCGYDGCCSQFVYAGYQVTGRRWKCLDFECWRQEGMSRALLRIGEQRRQLKIV